MSTLAWSMLWGGMLGLGAWLMLSAVPRIGRPPLSVRIAPQLSDVSSGARELLESRRSEVLPVLGSLGIPVTAVLRRLGSLLGSPEQLRLRLAQAGGGQSLQRYQGQRLLWGFAAALLAALAGVILPGLQQSGPVALAALVIVAGLCGILIRDRLLAQTAKQRSERITRELPTVLEFLTLSLAAGEGVRDALRRLAAVSSGLLAQEFALLNRQVAAGAPLGSALDELARRSEHPALSRAMRHFSAVLEHGSPLVEALRAQAGDVRTESRRTLMEAAGRKEVAMLVPLVFLILPATVVIAVFPGLIVLQAGF